MNIGIIGSGTVGKTLGGRLAQLGHNVVVGTRDPSKLSEWAAKAGGKVSIGSFADAAAHGEVVMNATAGTGSLAALQMAGPDKLNRKILIDVSNPLDFSRGMPPTLFLSNTDSLGEQIQAALPDVRVVKALNTVSSVVMIDPGKVGGGEHHLLICGNDPQAKAAVAARMEEWFGWKHILDLGNISMARGTEMYLALWVRLYGAMKTPSFNIRVVS